jgi:hypothetical protein
MAVVAAGRRSQPGVCGRSPAPWLLYELLDRRRCYLGLPAAILIV